MKIKTGEVYTFRQLEKYLNVWENRSKYLIVRNVEWMAEAVMHVFMENFSRDYQSGDGILFYNDGEAHSSEPDDEYELIEIKELQRDKP